MTKSSETRRNFHFFTPLNSDSESEHLFIQEHWTDNLFAVVVERRTTHIVIERWQEEDLSFLKKLREQILFLQVNFSTRIKDVTAINELYRLRELRLGCCASQIDFAKLPDLRRCSISHETPNPSISLCKTLQDVSIYEANIRDLNLFSDLRELKGLGIAKSRLKSLAGLSRLQQLETVGFNQMPLDSLHGLED